MKGLIKTWWNKPWTNGTYIKWCIGSFILMITYIGAWYMYYEGCFERISNWFNRLFHRNSYYEQNREAE